MAEYIGSGFGGITQPGVYSNGSADTRTAAPNSWWDALVTALEGSGAAQALRIKLNRLGRNNTDSPSEVASFVQGGGVYIDWCDWPWAGEGGVSGFDAFDAQGLGTRLDLTTEPGGFLGIGGGQEILFAWTRPGLLSPPPWSGLVDTAQYPFNRGLCTTTHPSTNGIQQTGPTTSVQYAFGSHLETIFIYSCVKVPSGTGRGAYFYAAVSQTFFNTANDSEAIQPATFIPFVVDQLGFRYVPASPSISSSSPSTTTTSTSRATTGSPAPGLPTMASCQSQVYTIADEGVSLPCVKTIQTRLNQLINAGLAVDGYYGPLTTAAVKTFQQQQGITVDGMTGPQTWSKLENPSSGPARAVQATPVQTSSSTKTSTASTSVSPPASSTQPTTYTGILGLTPTEEAGAAVVVFGLLALLLLNRG